MSERHPIIAITGSSGAGTSSVTRTFENIFRREGVNAAVIEGDSFHRFDRAEMKLRLAEAEAAGNRNFSHFGPENNLFPELAELFRSYAQSGAGQRRRYLHDAEEAAPYKQKPGTFTPWEAVPEGTDLLFYEGLHGAVATPEVDIAQYPDLLIGVVPVINLEWIRKLYRDIPAADESMVVIRFANPKGIDFQYLMNMIQNSFMSRANTIVVPGGKMELAMQLIFTPYIWRMMERRKRAQDVL